jgi:hypothetical protein
MQIHLKASKLPKLTMVLSKDIAANLKGVSTKNGTVLKYLGNDC